MSGSTKWIIGITWSLAGLILTISYTISITGDPEHEAQIQLARSAGNVLTIILVIVGSVALLDARIKQWVQLPPMPKIVYADRESIEATMRPVLREHNTTEINRKVASAYVAGARARLREKGRPRA